MTRVLIPGTGGFVGQKLCPAFEDAGFAIVPVYRTCQPGLINGFHDVIVGKTFDATTDWTGELADVDVVLHLAAKVHVMHGDESDVLNLTDLIRVCCLYPAAAGRIFLVSDDESISTVELIGYLSKGLQRKARLFFVTIWALKLAVRPGSPASRTMQSRKGRIIIKKRQFGRCTSQWLDGLSKE